MGSSEQARLEKGSNARLAAGGQGFAGTASGTVVALTVSPPHAILRCVIWPLRAPSAEVLTNPPISSSQQYPVPLGHSLTQLTAAVQALLFINVNTRH